MKRLLPVNYKLSGNSWQWSKREANGWGVTALLFCLCCPFFSIGACEAKRFEETIKWSLYESFNILLNNSPNKTLSAQMHTERAPGSEATQRDMKEKVSNTWFSEASPMMLPKSAFGPGLTICHSIFYHLLFYQLHAATSSWSNRIGLHRFPKQPKGESYMICTISLGSSSNCPLRMHTGRCGISLAAPPAHSSLAEGRKPRIHILSSKMKCVNYIYHIFHPTLKIFTPTKQRKNKTPASHATKSSKQGNSTAFANRNLPHR